MIWVIFGKCSWMTTNEALSAPKSQICQNELKFGMKSLFRVHMKIIILILIGRNQERNLGAHDQNELKFSMKSLSWFYMKMETK